VLVSKNLHSVRDLGGGGGHAGMGHVGMGMDASAAPSSAASSPPCRGHRGRHEVGMK
jgi:hypothetical protein